MYRLLSSIVAVAFLCFSACTDAQATNTDKIDFTTEAVWPDLRTCLQWVFSGYYDVFDVVGCETNACVCRGSAFSAAADSASSLGVEYCSDGADGSTAMSVLTQYCYEKGYTAVGSPSTVDTGSATPATNNAIFTTGSAIASNTQASTPQPTSSITNGGAVSSDSGDSGKLGTPDIIGIVTGIIGAVAAIIGVWLGLRHRSRQRQSASSVVGDHGMQPHDVVMQPNVYMQRPPMQYRTVY